MNALSFLYGGLFSLPWWGYLITALVLTHITIVAVTVYLHRHITHQALKLHPVVAHFFRAWLWLTTGMVTKQWKATHMQHHQKCETKDDPHSPNAQMKAEGISCGRRKGWFMVKFIFWRGVRSYVNWVDGNPKEVEELGNRGNNCPNDWFEKNIYSAHEKLGIVIMAVIDLTLFGGIPGFIIWGIQMIWIPVFAAGVINGVGHVWGYKNPLTVGQDESRNIIPWGILLGGEELHSNHHAKAARAKMSHKWYEFDIGYFWIKVIALFGGAWDIKR